MKPLRGKIALVAGATRGAGRGIACMLGEAGATVYCTGRSTRDQLASGKKRTETIEETAEMVDQYGGKGIWVRVDHRKEDEVKALCKKIKKEQGQLDILVNDIWGGDALTEWGKPFWELDVQQGFRMLETAIHTHILTSRYAVPLMLPQQSGLVVEITDGDTFSYKSNLFYDLAKNSVVRLAFGMAEELRKHQIAVVALTPGFLRSEAMLDHFGVTEVNWKDATEQDPHFIESETPYYVGRALASLAADADIFQKTGRLVSSWNLAQEYGFQDVDGRQPNWGKYFAETLGDTDLGKDFARSHEAYLNIV